MRTTFQRNLTLTACLLTSLAVANAATPTMPTFFARRDYTGLLSQSVQVADTNGDGIPDLINAGPDLEVLFGNGNGTFRPGPTSSCGSTSSGFVATDQLGDGKVDLVVPIGSGIAVCAGNGDGTFQSGVNYATDDSGNNFLVLGDFNGDGILDVATPGNQGVWLFSGKGDGTFNPGVLAASLPEGSYFIASADFNGDNKLDLVVTLTTGGAGGQGAGFVVLLGKGNGTFQTPQTFAKPMRPLSVVAGNLTKGGYPGIALSVNGSSDIFLYTGNGAGGFTGPTYADLPGALANGLALGDMNGDGIPDLVSSEGYVAYGEGNGHFLKPVSYTIDGGGNNVVLPDLRNNGLTDIVTSGYYVTSVLLSQGKGEVEDGIWTSVSGGASCGVTADFNGDGKPDLAVITSKGVSILLGTGKAATPFTTGTPIAMSGAACVVTGDLNGDGIPDLLVAVNGSPNAVLSYLGNGDGTFTLSATTATPNSGGVLVLADFNHDGKLDFATSGNLLALGNGDGTFQTPTAIVANPPSTGFSGIAAGDINKDGWPDLVLTNGAVPYNNVFVLLNNQGGGFTQVPTNFGATTFQPILADLTGDGDLGLILAPVDGTGAAVYGGNGKGQFKYEEGLSGPFGAVNAFNVVADINGDGIPDVLVLGYDTLMVYLGEGSLKYASPFSIGTGPDPNNILVAKPARPILQCWSAGYRRRGWLGRRPGAAQPDEITNPYLVGGRDTRLGDVPI
jgi:hypothetical protein